MIKCLLFILISLQLLQAEDDLFSLLNQYESQSALHNKTKDELAGHLVIFSRQDLDKMQAHTLKDILKSVKGFNLQEGMKGNAVLQRAGASCGSSGCVRVYINDHEMSSAVNGSALEIFADYDLGHIDHVEIYLGGSTIKFGNEYGFITIKMYTKDPSRDKGGFLSTSYGSNNSYGMEAFHAGVSENDLEYLLYAKKKYSDNGEISNLGYTVPRYSDNINFYATIKKEDDFIVELSNYRTEHDALAGLGMKKTPEISEVYSKYQYATFTKYFNSLKFQASYSQENNGVYSRDENGIKLYNGSIVPELDVDFENSIIKLSLENTNKFKNASLFYGASYQRKGADKTTGTYIGLSSLDMYSGYAEYEYNLTQDNLIVATGKYSHYDHNGYKRSDDLYEYRVGLVSVISNDLTLKSFYAHNYIYPSINELITFDKLVDGNPDLKPMEIDNYSVELIYTKGQHTLGLMYMQMHIQDPVQVRLQQYVNLDVHAIFNDYIFDYTYTHSSNHKLMLEYYFTKHNRPSDASPAAGGYVKLFNTFGSFDIYNELVYREGYYSQANLMNIENGYDWTLAFTYHVNKEFTLALKGVNILDKSIASPVRGLYPVQTRDKKITLYATWSY